MSKKIPAVLGGHSTLNGPIGIGEAEAVKPEYRPLAPGRARFVPIDDQDEQLNEDREAGRPRRDSTSDE
jgi:hypothetical protein